MRKKKITALLSLLLCLTFLAVPVWGETAFCADLSKKCTYKCTQKKASTAALSDDRITTFVRFKAGATVTVSWKADLPAKKVYYFANILPESFTLTQKTGDSEILREDTFVPEHSCGLIELEEGCQSIVLTFSSECTVNSLNIFGAGDALPEKYVFWTDETENPYSELMLFSAHYDDEILFMAAVPILYAGRDGRDVQVVYMRGSNMDRRLEAIQGLWYMGVKREPVCLKFSTDNMQMSVVNDGAPGLQDDYIGIIVELLRRYKPKVVVTHDVAGEYGHKVHIYTSALVCRAVEMASDENCYPESAAQYGTWQVQKLYIHLYGENTIELDMGPVAAFQNQKVIKIAVAAMRFHKSQSRWSAEVQHANYPMNRYGLYFTAVGPDTPGMNDMFEHVG